MIKNIKDAIGEGVQIGREKYNDHTCFSHTNSDEGYDESETDGDDTEMSSDDEDDD